MRPGLRLKGRLSRALIASVMAAGCGQLEDARSAATYSGSGCPGVAGETVHWIVASTAGGGQDVFARLLEPFYEAAIGAQIVVENRGGAGGAIGARAIRDAEPDGRTLGIMNGTARLVADLSDELQGLHPLNDFTVLGRLAVDDPVWLTRTSSRYRTIEDVLANPSGDSLLVGITDVGGSGFLYTSVPAELLALDLSYVSGYPGGREYSMALVRGEIDVGGISFESARDLVDSGDLTPILQLTDEPVAEHPSLSGVPLLAGPDGVAARVARARGEDPAEAIAMAGALEQLFSVGRLVVAPPDLSSELSACLSARLAEIVRDPTFLAAASKAQRTIRFADPVTLAAEVQATDDDLRSLAAILRQQIATARGAVPGR